MEQLGQTETLVNLVPLGMMVPEEAQDLWDPQDHPDPKEMEEWRVFQEIRGSQETLGKMVLLVYPERREMMDFPVLLVTKEILGLLVPQAHGVILEEEKGVPAKKVNVAWMELMGRMVNQVPQGPEGLLGLRVRKVKTEPLE